MGNKICIRRINGERCVYQGNRLVANIYDHRRRSKTDRYSTIQGDWGVAWTSGRYDWHNTYAEARDNALKGSAAVAAPAGLERARSDIERAGFAVQVRGDHLVVADPVFSCGQGKDAGKLIPAGFEQVVIRSQQQAWRFLRVRI